MIVTFRVARDPAAKITPAIAGTAEHVINRLLDNLRLTPCPGSDPGLPVSYSPARALSTAGNLGLCISCRAARARPFCVIPWRINQDPVMTSYRSQQPLAACGAGLAGSLRVPRCRWRLRRHGRVVAKAASSPAPRFALVSGGLAPTEVLTQDHGSPL